MGNLFQDSTKTLPKTADSQIVRVDMEKSDIGGRKSHLPTAGKNDMMIAHIPSKGK